MDFLGFVVWEISGHFWGVYQSHYCASAVAFLFSFVYVIYLNIASHLYGKQIKSKLWTKLYLWMIFICVRLNRLHFHECRPMPLNTYTCNDIPLHLEKSYFNSLQVICRVLTWKSRHLYNTCSSKIYILVKTSNRTLYVPVYNGV